jgi:cytochrome P450
VDDSSLFDEVNGITIAKGTQFQFPIWASHHNEEFFPEPEEFRPGLF